MRVDVCKNNFSKNVIVQKLKWRFNLMLWDSVWKIFSYFQTRRSRMMTSIDRKPKLRKQLSLVYHLHHRVICKYISRPTVEWMKWRHSDEVWISQWELTFAKTISRKTLLCKNWSEDSIWWCEIVFERFPPISRLDGQEWWLWSTENQSCANSCHWPTIYITQLFASTNHAQWSSEWNVDILMQFEFPNENWHLQKQFLERCYCAKIEVKNNSK